MRHPHALARATLLAGLALAPAAAAPTPGAPPQEMRSSDHKSLGRTLGRYFESLDSPKDAEKARESLREDLEKIGKKIAGRDGDALQAALALTADLGEVVVQSFGYKNVRGGKVSGETVGGRGGEIEYALWLPGDYKASAGTYPLVVIVPDTKDGRPVPGDQFLTEHWLEPELRDNLVLAVVNMPEDSAAWGELFVERGGDRAPGGLSYLMTVYADVRQKIAVDSDRVYLAGRGAGVGVVMKLGSYFPQVFAGVIGRAGDTGDVSCENFQNLPTLLVGAGGQATAFSEKAKELGYEGVTLKPDASGEEVWTWVQDHPRSANPTKVSLYPGSPIPNRSYWLQIPPTDVDPGTYVKAEADRATNTIVVEGRGVTTVILYFNDVLVDLDKPVKLVLNGQEQTTTIPRSLDDFLNLLERGTSDSGRLYVAVRDFDLPE